MTLDPNDPRLTAYVLGELDPAECELVENLLKENDAAGMAVDEIRITAGWLTSELRHEQQNYVALPLPIHQSLTNSLAPAELHDGDKPSIPLPSTNHQPASDRAPRLPTAAKWWRSPRALRLGSIAAVLLVGAGIARLALAPRNVNHTGVGRHWAEASRAVAVRYEAPAAKKTSPQRAIRTIQDEPAATVVMTDSFQEEEALAAAPPGPAAAATAPGRAPAAAASIPGPLRRRTVVLESVAVERGRAGLDESRALALGLSEPHVSQRLVPERLNEDARSPRETELKADASKAAKLTQPAPVSRGEGAGFRMMAGQFAQEQSEQATLPRKTTNASGDVPAPKGAAMSRSRGKVPVPVAAPAGASAMGGLANPSAVGDAIPTGAAGKPIPMANAPEAPPAAVVAKSPAAPALKTAGQPQVKMGIEPAFRAGSLAAPAARMMSEPLQSQAPANRWFRSVGEAPESAFLVDVDRASYASIRRSLDQNMLPQKDDVRIEELLNAFPQHDAGPSRSNPDPLAIHIEIAGCPWDEQHRLARIAIAARPIDQDARRACNLVFLIDNATSMREPGRLPLFQWSLNRLVDQLGERDRLAIVAFGQTPGVVLPSTSGREKAKIRAAVDDLKVASPENQRSGLALAYEIATQSQIDGGANRVIVATDDGSRVVAMGQAALAGVVVDKAARGISMSVLGMGSRAAGEATLATLAKEGDGHLVLADSPLEAYRVLVEETGAKLATVATNARVRVQFNAGRVSAYRLLGYDGMQLPSEASIDDSRDGGAIALGHHVTALYELAPNDVLQVAGRGLEAAPEGLGRRIETLKVHLTYKTPGDGRAVFKEQFGFDAGTDFAHASDDFKITAALGGFGLRLRGPAFPPRLSYDLVRQIIEPYLVDGRDPAGDYHELARLLYKAKMISAGPLLRR